MSGADRTYTDRFGNEWLAHVEPGGDAKRVTFTCGRFQLVATDEESVTSSDGPTETQLKELFCDAERAITLDEQVWYVGYRARVGRGGRVQSGLHTRFRSEDGEVRYAREMILFRQMAEETLCEHLTEARVPGPAPKHRR